VSEAIKEAIQIPSDFVPELKTMGYTFVWLSVFRVREIEFIGSLLLAVTEMVCLVSFLGSRGS